MNAQKIMLGCLVAGFASLLALTSSRVAAQGLMEQNTAMGMNDALSGGSASGGLNSNLYMGRAQQAAATSNAYNAQYGGNPQGGMPVNPNDPNAMAQGGMPGTPGAPGMPGMPGMTAVAIKKITVIAGTRVFDAVSRELVDDAIRKMVPESEKTKYFDDGTHGDLVENDGIYTKVDGEKRDAIGAANQKVKAQLVQALRVAESYSPVEFYGFSLMSTDRAEPLPRNEAWKVVKDPKGIGYQLAEQPVSTPMSVPKYRDKLKEKDATVKEDWSFRFLQEYRKKKDDLSSEFFSVYIPMPPQPPGSMPPPTWMPFGDPGSLTRAQQARNPVMGGAMGGGMMGGGMMGGGTMGNMGGGGGGGRGGRGGGRRGG